MRIRELRFVTAFCVIAISAFAILHGWELATVATPRDLEDERYNPADRNSVKQRIEAFTNILAERPASSLHWALLAQAQLQAGESPERVLRTLALSAVTGPNEGTVMAERARLGILLWESMPGDLKKRIIDDLAGFNLNDPINPGSALSLRPQDVREDIAAALVKTPGISVARLQRLGIAQ
jgi:hypothetical protein